MPIRNHASKSLNTPSTFFSVLFHLALRSKSTSILLCCFLTTIASTSTADTFSIEGNFGQAMIGNDQYHNGFSQDISGAYHNGDIILRLGGFKLDEIELKDSRNSYIDIDGIYIEISKEFDFKNLSVELGGGYIDASTEAYFLNEKIIEQDDSSPFINAKVALRLSSIFSLVADWKYIKEVSGEDINVAQVGARFTF